MSIKDNKNWKVIDPSPGMELNEISPMHKRITALYSRNKENFDEHQLIIMGAIFAIKGLEYHYQNFQKIVSNNNCEDESESLKHEAIAYLNQLYIFFEALGQKTTGIKKSKIKNLLKIRHKYQHKELKKENCEERFFYLELSFCAGTLSNGKYPIFQYQDVNKKYIEFDMTKDHQLIMEEMYEIFTSKIKK